MEGPRPVRAPPLPRRLRPERQELRGERPAPLRREVRARRGAARAVGRGRRRRRAGQRARALPSFVNLCSFLCFFFCLCMEGAFGRARQLSWLRPLISRTPRFPAEGGHAAPRGCRGRPRPVLVRAPPRGRPDGRHGHGAWAPPPPPPQLRRAPPSDSSHHPRMLPRRGARDRPGTPRCTSPRSLSRRRR